MLITIISAISIFIISFIVMDLISRVTSISYKDDENQWVPIVLLFLTIAIGFGASADAQNKTEIILEQTQYMEIQSIEGNSVVSGHFTLGYGQVQEDFVYVFYKQEDDGSYTMDYVKSSGCKIIESDDEIPNIKYFKPKIDKPNWWTKWGTVITGSKSKEQIVITVPVGTIRKSYSGSFN